MKLRKAMTAFVALYCLLVGCRSANEAIPDELIGVWKTNAATYEDNSIELRKDSLVWGTGKSNYTVNPIVKVEEERHKNEQTLYKIDYTGEEGGEYLLAFYYDPTNGGTIRFKNQKQIEWKLFERRPPVTGSLSPRRPADSWWNHFSLSMVLALFGVGLTTAAALWGWRESREGKWAATDENGETGFAQSRGGGREPSEMWAAEGGIDGTHAPPTIPAIAEREKRRSERILLKIPVNVAGIDAYGKSFEELTFTISINRDGAFLWIRNSLREGDHITVTNLGTRKSCAFRLRESDKDPSSEFMAWGIECLEPDANFWQIRFPDKPPEPSPQKNITALIECDTCHSREVAELSVALYRNMLERESMKRNCSDCSAVTEWKFILVEATSAGSPEETPAPGLPPGEENRREKRIVAKLPIRLRYPEDGRVESTLTENVSKSGVCCAASMELNVDDAILLTFESGTGPSEDENPARIMWRRPLGEHRKILYGIRLERKEL